MKKRTVKIAVIVAAVLVIGLFGYFVLLPRILLYIAVKDIPGMDKMPEYYTDFSLSSSGNVKKFENGYFSMMIPSGLENEAEQSDSRDFYIDRNTIKTIFIDKEPSDMSAIAILSQNTIDYYSEKDPDLDMNGLKKAFERCGHGIPDTVYSSYKCMYSFSRDDYSFWDRNKAQCYVFAAVTKSTVPRNADVLFYERDDVKAVIWDIHDEDDEKVSVNLFNVNDLNMQFTLYFSVGSSEEAFAMINSIEFTGEASENTV